MARRIRYSRILVAVGGGPGDERIVDTAAALAAEDATLTLFTTVRAPHWSFLAIGFVSESAACAPRAVAAAILARARALAPVGLRVERRLATGSLGDALALEGASGAYDVVVAPSSDSRRLVRRCSAPVFVVPVSASQRNALDAL